MRLFLLIANLLTLIVLATWLSVEWDGFEARNELGIAIAVFASGMILSALNFAYIRNTEAERSNISSRLSRAWSAFRS